MAWSDEARKQAAIARKLKAASKKLHVLKTGTREQKIKELTKNQQAKLAAKKRGDDFNISMKGLNAVRENRAAALKQLNAKSSRVEGMALTKAYASKFTGKQPTSSHPPIALTAAHSKTGKAGGPLKGATKRHPVINSILLSIKAGRTGR